MISHYVIDSVSGESVGDGRTYSEAMAVLQYHERTSVRAYHIVPAPQYFGTVKSDTIGTTRPVLKYWELASL